MGSVTVSVILMALLVGASAICKDLRFEHLSSLPPISHRRQNEPSKETPGSNGRPRSLCCQSSSSSERKHPQRG